MSVLRGSFRSRADGRLKETVIITASASVLPEDEQRSLVMGSNAFLRKPVQAEQLYHLLESLLHLTWEYSPLLPVETSTADALVEPLPPEVLHPLNLLVQMGDISEIVTQADALRSAYPVFARRVRQFADLLQLKPPRRLYLSAP